ncbi:MAG: hypothetical protein ACODAJ_16410 [Planctomycetota bacterium]
MTQAELIQEVVRHLDEAALPYMITGSVASGRYGEVRSTFDTDIVVDAEWPALREFVRSFGDEFYADEQMARDAWARASMFNIIHFASGQKIDIIRRKNRKYSRVAFQRRRIEQAMGVEVALISPEDSILSKLEWSKKGESERQYRDALGVAKAQRTALDLAYLRRWASELRVSELLDRLLTDAELASDQD